MQKVRMSVSVAFACLLPFSTGCAPITAGADFPLGQAFGGYTSFSWDEPEERPTGDPRLDRSPLFQQRVHAAIEWELSTRGIRLANEGQDEFEFGEVGRAFSVHHHTSIEDHVAVYGTVEPGLNAVDEEEMRVVEYPRATFIVGLVDAQTRELVWSAWAELDFEDALANPRVMQRQVDAAVAAMFDLFPVPVGGAVADAR